MTQSLSIIIMKDPATVFRALIEPSQLKKWFTPDVDVNLDKKSYDFWGRYIPETPVREQGHHPVTAFEANHRLEFTWKLRGQETTVKFEVEDSPDGCKVTVTHSDLPPRPQNEFSVTDFWYAVVENLRGWVERGAEGIPVDYSRIPTGEVKLTVDIDRDPAEVYDALMNTEKVDKLFGGKSEIEPKVGGTYTYGWPNDGPLKILDLKPEKELKLEWHYKGEERTVLTWQLEGSDGRTRLTLVHSGWTKDRKMGDYYAGWSSFLSMIKNFVESNGVWQPAVREGVTHEAV